MHIKKEAVTLSISSSGIATLLLTQGRRGNPIDGVFCRDFRDTMNELALIDEVRVLVIQAEGPNFSVGGDIKTFAQKVEELPGLVLQWTSDLHIGLSRFWKLPYPVIVQVHGSAMGGAVGVLAGADIVVAGASARFGSAFTKLGFSCDSGSSLTLSMRMGVARARRFVMLTEVLSAEDAQSAGLVDEVIPDDKLVSYVAELASRLANGPTVALGEIRRLFFQVGAQQAERQLEDEAQTLTRVSRTEDAKAAIKAFVTQEPVTFRGR